MSTVQTITDQVKAAFDFEVVKLPLTGPDNLHTGVYGLFRNDKTSGAFVGSGSVTDRYVPHKTSDVVALVEAASEAFEIEADVKCSFNNGHRVVIQPTNDYRRQIYNSSDSLFPRVIINAGFDGKAFKATVGTYRDACSNLMMARAAKSASANIKHIGDLESKMSDLVKTFRSLAGSWDDLIELFSAMESREVVLSDYLKTIFGECKHTEGRGLTQYNDRLDAIRNRMLKDRDVLGRGPAKKVGDDVNAYKITGWEAFNAVQGYFEHEATRKSGTSDLDRALLASRASAVVTAERLALGLAV